MTSRVVIMGVALGAAIVVIFAVRNASLRSLGRATAATAAAAQITDASRNAEKSILDMETGIRGYLLTRQRSFLAPWYAGREAFPREFARLVRLTGHDRAGDMAPVFAIGRDGNDYIHAYGARFAVAGLRPMGAAAVTAVAAEGKRRVDALKALFATVARLNDAHARLTVAAADAADRRARRGALFGVGGALLLIALAGVYLVRRVSRPIGRVADAAEALSAGEPSIRAPATGPGEVRRLGRSFNEMAAAIEQGSSTLRLRNHELSEARATAERTAVELATQQFLAVDLISTIGFDGTFKSVNPAWEKTLGFSEAELISRPFIGFVHPEDRERTEAEAARVAAAGTDAVSFENRYRARDGSYRWLEWNARPVVEEELLYCVARDTTERKQAEHELRVARRELQAHNEALAGQIEYRTRELERSRVEAFDKLALAAEYRDDQTREHTRRVGRIAAALARELGFEPEMVDAVTLVAPLHDLGKIGIPDAILLKPGKLTEAEFAAMREHAVIGASILSGSASPLFKVAADIALTHHERWDGTGYPLGLAGDAIPLPGRIVALADAFDAMSHDRPYKQAISLPEALAEIDRASGAHFDPAVVRAFHRLDIEGLRVAAAPAARTPARSLAQGPAWAGLQQLGLDTISRSGAAIDAVLAAAFNRSAAAALILDDDRRCVGANHAACRLLGVALDDLRHERIDEFLPPEARTHLDVSWAEFMQAGAQTSQVTLLLPDDSTVDVTARTVAELLPGRHLALIEPRSARGKGAARPERRSPTWGQRTASLRRR